LTDDDDFEGDADDEIDNDVKDFDENSGLCLEKFMV